MKSFFKLVATLMSLFIIALGGFSLWLFLKTNVNTPNDKVISALEEKLEQRKLASPNISDKKVTKATKSFIIDALMRGLPKLQEERETCLRNIDRELVHRKINIHDIDFGKVVGKSAAEVIEFHTMNFNANTFFITDKLDKLFFDLDKFRENYKEISSAIGDKVYFEALNSYVENENCYPRIYKEKLERFLSSSEKVKWEIRDLLVHNKYQWSYIPSKLNQSILKKESTAQKKESVIVLSEFKDLSLSVANGFNKENYLPYMKKHKELGVDYYKSLGKSKLKKSVAAKTKKTKKGNKIKKKRKKFNRPTVTEVFDRLKEMPRKQKERIYKAIDIFYTDISKDQEVIVSEMMDEDLMSDEYKYKAFTSMMKPFVEMGLMEGISLLEIDRNNKEETIAKGVIQLLNSADKLDKEDFFKRKRRSLSARERAQYQDTINGLIRVKNTATRLN